MCSQKLAQISGCFPHTLQTSDHMSLLWMISGSTDSLSSLMSQELLSQHLLVSCLCDFQRGPLLSR